MTQFAGIALQRKCACGQHTPGASSCSACARKDETLQRHTARQSEDARTVAPPIVHEVLGSAGQPLEGATRAFMESRFAHDFSRVRVHTDEKAAQSAQAVNALAYTVGRDVVFGAGRYAPQTHEGRKLIAHELTHTVQQSSTNHLHGKSLTVSPASDAGEHEAERAASLLDAANASSPSPVTQTRQSSVMQPRLQRQPAPFDDPMADPIHAPGIEQYRREQGLPVSGVDESGRPVGPSAAQIKYGKVKMLCPHVGTSKTREDMRAALCIGQAEPGMPWGCDFREEHEKLLRTAKDEAAARVKRASSRIKSGADGRAFADELAKRLFLFDIPSVAQVIEVLDKLVPLLSGDKVQFAGRSCADPTCHLRPAVAYVTGAGQLPIYICPLAFHEPAKIHQFVLHEALHWTGIDADPATDEFYCQAVDCMTPCAGQDVADAWMHYLTCLGQPLETRKKSFVPKMIESVNEIP